MTAFISAISTTPDLPSGSPKLPLAEQPRTLWDYGHSIDVLGRVIEVASGQSLYQFEKSQLFDPLGMTTTKFFLTDPAERARYAQPLRKDRHTERNSLDVTRWESGGGGLVTTVADFARYGQMLLNGGALDGKTYLSSKTFAAMTTDHIGPGSGVERNFFYFPVTGLGSAMASVSAPIPAMQCPRRRVRPAKSNGTVRPALISWSTAPRTCSLSCWRTRRRPGSMCKKTSRSWFTMRSKNDAGMTGAETMLRKAGESDQVATMTAGRIVALDRARTFITLLVVIHHSVVNYTHFGNGDQMRWLGFDLMVLFNDSFLMACMFLILGLFVHDSLARKGKADSCAVAPGGWGYRFWCRSSC